MKEIKNGVQIKIQVMLKIYRIIGKHEAVQIIPGTSSSD